MPLSNLPEPDSDINITDFEAEDYTAGDEDIVITDEVITLAAQMRAIECIEDEDERLEAARAWARQLNGEE
jgi:hypothetical protein